VNVRAPIAGYEPPAGVALPNGLKNGIARP